MMKQFMLALQFLTILPINIKGEIEAKDFGRCMIYFPIVGAIIGLILAIVSFWLNFVLPFSVNCALILTLSVILTGALHLDGLADTCDGLCLKRPREEILGIMRDSRVGAIGACFIVLILLIKYSSFVALGSENLWKILIIMPSIGRFMQVFAAYMCKYAREDGKARNFIGKVGKREIIFAALSCVAICSLILGVRGLMIFIAVFIFSALFLVFINRKLDGMTGDTIGALSEIAEVNMLLSSLIIIAI